MKVEPDPGAEVTVIVPPCISMKRLEIARPRPVPPFLALANSSNSRPSSSAGMPGPSSMKSNTTVSAVEPTATLKWPGLPAMASAAFRNLVALQEGRPLKPFVYRDKGSLVSLAHFQTVGSLMGNLVGGRMAIEGRIARFVYVSLYRLHIMAIHGRLGGLSMIALRPATRALRPRLKLH